MLHLLKKYSPKYDRYVTLKKNLLDNVSKFYEEREKIIEGFKNKVFAVYYDEEYEEQMEFEKEEEERKIFDANKFSECVNEQETQINKELFKNHFSFFKEMSEEERKIGKPVQIVKVIKRILKKGLKILTPNQMLSRLPITLTQLK